MLGKTSPYVLNVKLEHISGYRCAVAVWANDKLVILSKELHHDDAVGEVHKIKGLLGLLSRFEVTYYINDSSERKTEEIEASCIKEASEWANKNCPVGTWRMEIKEIL